MSRVKTGHDVRLPDERTTKISYELQKWGDSIHRMNVEKYEMAECILSLADREKLHEAILDTQNFLAYNGSWDFHAETIALKQHFTCSLSFKWNGCLSNLDHFTKMRLPDGVTVTWKFRPESKTR